MSAATLAPPDPTAVTPPPKLRPAVTPEPADVLPYGGLAGLWRFSVADYERMITAGILLDDTPVELLSGFVVKKMSRGLAHNLAVRVLTMRLARMLPAGWTQGPATTAVMGDDSMPEPDFSVIRGEPGEFADRRATGSDIPLVIEVSDSSIRRDQREKLAIYAASGVREYWIVNIPDRRVEVYTQPSGDTYAASAAYTAGQDVPVLLDGTQIGAVPVDDLFRKPVAG